jgi:hypothetical protein
LIIVLGAMVGFIVISVFGPISSIGSSVVRHILDLCPTLPDSFGVV